LAQWKELEDVFRPRQIHEDTVMTLLAQNPDPTLVVARCSVIDTIIRGGMDLPTEIGGILLGAAYVLPKSNSHLTHVRQSLFATGGEGSSSHFRFTSSSWETMRKQIREEHVVIGWFHTHPGLGIFMSETDRRTQRHFFAQPWQVSLVVDPISGDYGFFAGMESEPVSEILISIQTREGCGELWEESIQV